MARYHELFPVVFPDSGCSQGPHLIVTTDSPEWHRASQSGDEVDGYGLYADDIIQLWTDAEPYWMAPRSRHAGATHAGLMMLLASPILSRGFPIYECVSFGAADFLC